MDTQIVEEKRPLIDFKDDDLDVPSLKLSIDPPPYRDASIDGEKAVTTPDQEAGTTPNPHNEMIVMVGYLTLMPFCGLMFLGIWALATIFPFAIVTFRLQMELRGFHIERHGWRSAGCQFAIAFVTIMVSRLLFFITLIRKGMKNARAGTKEAITPKQSFRMYSRILFIYSLQFALAAIVIIMLSVRIFEANVSPSWKTTPFKQREAIEMKELEPYKDAFIMALSYTIVMLGMGLKTRYQKVPKQAVALAGEETPVVGSEAV